MSNFPIWEKPPSLAFVGRSSNCLLFDRKRAADLRQITTSSVIQTVVGRSLFAFRCVRCIVHAAPQLHLSFQEVVEKNLRHIQDTKKKRDDGESADNDSILSTSSNLEPFATDDLGELVHAARVWSWNTMGSSLWAC